MRLVGQTEALQLAILATLFNADTAMYRAKERGRNNFQFHTAGLNARMTRRWVLE